MRRSADVETGPALATALAALEHNALAVWLRTSLAYPVLETLHIVGLESLFGSLLIVDMGLLGQYLPKGMDMREVTQAELDWIAKQLNDRPRKTLHWVTPNAVWRAMLDGKTFDQAVALGA
jgi:hypothetical protein